MKETDKIPVLVELTHSFEHKSNFSEILKASIILIGPGSFDSYPFGKLLPL